MKTRKNVKSRRNRRKSAKSRCRKHRYTLRGGLKISDKPGLAWRDFTGKKHRTGTRIKFEQNQEKETAAAAALKEREKRQERLEMFNQQTEAWARMDHEREAAKPVGEKSIYSIGLRRHFDEVYPEMSHDEAFKLYAIEERKWLNDFALPFSANDSD